MGWRDAGGGGAGAGVCVCGGGGGVGKERGAAWRRHNRIVQKSPVFKKTTTTPCTPNNVGVSDIIIIEIILALTEDCTKVNKQQQEETRRIEN